MDTEAALLDAVLAAPDDDLPRLVYADWLDEQDGPVDRIRAKLLRAACRLAAMPESDPGRRQLAELCRQYCFRSMTWLADDPDAQWSRWSYEFDLGIPVLVVREVPSAERPLPALPPGCGGRLVQNPAPGTPAELAGWTGQVTGWASAARVVGVHFRGGYVHGGEGNGLFRRLLDGTLFPRIQAVEWQCGRGLTDADLDAVTPPPTLRRLTITLDDVSAEAVIRLLAGPVGERLTELTLVAQAVIRPDRFAALHARLRTTVVKDQGYGRGEFDIPRPGRPPLRLVIDDDIPF